MCSFNASQTNTMLDVVRLYVLTIKMENQLYYLIGPGLWTEVRILCKASSSRTIPHHI